MLNYKKDLLEKLGINIGRHVKLPVILTDQETLTRESTAKSCDNPAGLTHKVLFRPFSGRSIKKILVLNNMPILNTSEVLVHEMIHSWLHMAMFPDNLPNDVEEGLCQLIAYLWLNEQKPTPETKRLMKLIEINSSPVYGKGFLDAFCSLRNSGGSLKNMLDYVYLYRKFPFKYDEILRKKK